MAKANWETVAGLEWRRVKNGRDNSDRPMYEYHAVHGHVNFDIVKSTDAGFGISVYDKQAKAYLTHHFGIEWRRSLKNCHARAVEIMDKIRNAK